MKGRFRAIGQLNLFSQRSASASVHILTVMDLTRPSVAIVGVGAMGGALLTGLLNAGWDASDHHPGGGT